MRTGRPPSANRKRLPELEAMADWFVQAIEEAGYRSILKTAELTGLNQRTLYDVVNAARMLPLPVVQTLARGLGHDPEKITCLWAEAKKERDRLDEAERHRTHPGLTAWDDIPFPAPALRDLLEAQDGILDCLPYSVLGLEEPPLSAVYVRQTIQSRPTSGPSDIAKESPEPRTPSAADDGTRHTTAPDGPVEPVARPPRDVPAGASATDPAVQLPEALARYDHLLITGEAGAGKSTLAGHLVRSLCGVWLRRSTFQEATVAEPLLPLRLSASALAAGSGSWSERLRSAALSTLGGTLCSDPPASLFTGRTQGARWLVCVDGLDEIADRHQRAELIRMLAQHSRRDSGFRLMMTCRPLPPAELAPLRNAMLGEFEMQPFGQDELRDYVHKWFSEQHSHVPRPAAAADRFLVEVAEEGELKELVRNPLLATIALVNATLEPSQPPPSSRLALYESFLARLRERTARGAAIPAWLEGSADALVRALARARTEGEEDLVQAARNWMRQRPSEQPPLPPGWESELPSALVTSGLLVASGDQLRFLHQSFAEFLAAREYADEIPVDGEGLEEWIRRACHSDQQSLALFVLCGWAKRAKCSQNQLVDRILGFPYPERVLLAGSTMAEGIDVEPECGARVVRRLVDVLRNDDDNDDCQKAARTLSALDRRYGTASVLEELAAAPELPVSRRFYALSALSRVAPPATTAHLLIPMLELLYGLLPEAARLARHLDEAVCQAVRQRLTDLVGEPDADAWETSIAAETYQVLGSAEEVEQMARSVLEDPLAPEGSVRRAAASWLEAAPATALITALGHARPPTDLAGRLAIAQTLERNGAMDEAAELARTIMDSTHESLVHQTNAAQLWLRVRGGSAAEPVLRLFNRARETGWETWRQAYLLRHMGEAGLEYPAQNWCKAILSGTHELPIGSNELIRLWLANRGQDGMAEVHSLLGTCTRLHPFDRAAYACLLLDGGLTEEASRVAEQMLCYSGGRSSDYKNAAQVLLKIDRAHAIAFLTARLGDQPGTSTWYSGVLEAIFPGEAEPDLDELGLRIAEHVLRLPGSEGDHVEKALIMLLAFGGRDRLEYIAERICRHPSLNTRHQRSLAQALASCGENETALVIWRHLLSLRGYSLVGFSLLEDVAEALTFEGAEELVRERLTAEPASNSVKRQQLEGMLAWLATAPTRS